MMRECGIIEGMHRDVAADQLGGKVGLQVGKGENEIGLERQDLLEVGGNERRHPRFLLAHARRPHRITGDADDTVLLAEEIERLDGFFCQADDTSGREHFVHLLLRFHPRQGLQPKSGGPSSA